MTSSTQFDSSATPDTETSELEEDISDANVGITRISYRGYKALGFYDLPLGGINILTGTNNAGKSTALSVLRILASGLSVANRRKPTPIETPLGKQLGYVVPTAGLAISLENVHTNLDERDATVTFTYANGGELELRFPKDGGCLLVVGANSKKTPKSPKTFRDFFDTGIVHVPVLGPLEHDERLLNEDTVKAGATTHRACRHFRNYWHYFPDNFDLFAELLSSTWPGMTV